MNKVHGEFVIMASYGTAHIMVWYGAVRQTTAQQDGVYHIHTTTYFVYVTYLVEFSCMSELFVFHSSIWNEWGIRWYGMI